LTTYLGTSLTGYGYFRTYNDDGKQTAYLGTALEGFGLAES